jgi:hypothetical protein
MEHKEKRKWYFFSLCVFFVFFVANCTKGLVVIASASVFSTEFQLIRGSCKAEVAICQNFVGSTKTEERNQWAATFFGISGVNLLGTKADGTASKAPTQAAQNAWDARQSNDTYLRETIQLLGQASNAAIHVFTLNVIVALSWYWHWGAGGSVTGVREKYPVNKWYCRLLEAPALACLYTVFRPKRLAIARL